MTAPTPVVFDANVLINLATVRRLDILGHLIELDPLALPEVLAEISRPQQRAQVEEALRQGHLRRVVLDDLAALSLFADLRGILGVGESACLALAAHRGWWVASDERRVFLREALRRLGPGRILNTPGIFLLGLRKGVLTVEEADEAKKLLEQHRFRMTFSSFRDLL